MSDMLAFMISLFNEIHVLRRILACHCCMTSLFTDGGKNPVWNQTFKFNIINDNSVTIEVRDEDVGKDDTIGHCQVSLAKVRSYGRDTQQASVMSKSGKQHGFVQVSMTFSKNSAIGAPHYGAPPPAAYPPQPSYPYPAQHAPPPAVAQVLPN